MQSSNMNRQRSASATGVIQSTIDILDEHVVVIDACGLILAVNAAWREFANANDGDPVVWSTGANYLDVCDRAAGRGCSDAAMAAALIRSVILGKSASAVMEYQCDSPTEQRWFKLKIARSHVPGSSRFVIEHENIVAPTLAASRIRLQANLLASVEQAVIATDLSGTIVYWHSYAERMYGWSAEEVLGRNIIDITPTESSQA
jgi:hypothetical protein